MRDCTFANVFIQVGLTQQENRANLLRLVCRLPQTHQMWKQIPLITTARVLSMVDNVHLLRKEFSCIENNLIISDLFLFFK